jgi:ABC-type nitrate/sulfonate/bicarbonate transport system substrate-binding protein
MLTRRTALLLPLLASLPARASETVRIGQATTSLSFLPLFAARALDAFSPQSLTLDWAVIQGGDPAALAALDAGDLDFAAVGGETALQAVSKGQPFTLVYSLMSRMSLELVVGPNVKTQASDPLPQRLAALKGLTVGVSAIGGTQDRAVRWLGAKGGLARTDVDVAMVGGPPALQAALENKRIDAFILSPPESQIATAAGYGHTLINLAADFPELRNLPFLALVAKRPFDQEPKIRSTVLALQAAAAALHADPDSVATRIATKFFPRVAPALVVTAVKGMLDGVTDGAMSDAAIASQIAFATESGIAIGKVGDVAWTNRFIRP